MKIHTISWINWLFVVVELSILLFVGFNEFPTDAPMTMMFASVGVVFFLFKMNQIFSLLWHYFLRPRTSFEEFRGEWGVVTGASRGIGRGYAIGLARRGINLILISRTKEDLEKVAEECEKFKVKTVTIVADLSMGPETFHDIRMKISHQIQGNISVLVNNVGGKPPPHLPRQLMPSNCEHLDIDSYQSFYQINVLPTLYFTLMFLEDMVKRDKGYILNVSSWNANLISPGLSPYSVVKAYIRAYSKHVDAELRERESDVRVEVVCSGPVATDGILMGSRKGNRHVPDPVDFAEQSLCLAKTSFAELPWPTHAWSFFKKSCVGNSVK